MSQTRTEPDWNAYAAELAAMTREELEDERDAWLRAARVLEHLSTAPHRVSGAADGLGVFLGKVRLVERALVRLAEGVVNAR